MQTKNKPCSPVAPPPHALPVLLPFLPLAAIPVEVSLAREMCGSLIERFDLRESAVAHIHANIIAWWYTSICQRRKLGREYAYCNGFIRCFGQNPHQQTALGTRSMGTAPKRSQEGAVFLSRTPPCVKTSRPLHDAPRDSTRPSLFGRRRLWQQSTAQLHRPLPGW